MFTFLAFFNTPLGKIAGGAVAIVIAIAAFMGWLAWHDHNVLQGYVRQSALEAANAKAAELKHQADASASAVQSLNDQIEKQHAIDAQDDAAREKEISDYEQQLASANRRCLASAADVSAILHNNAKPPKLGHH